MEEVFKSFMDTEDFIDVCHYYNTITNNKLTKKNNLNKSSIIVDTFLHNNGYKNICKEDRKILLNILLNRFNDEDKVARNEEDRKDNVLNSNGDHKDHKDDNDDTDSSSNTSPLIQSMSSMDENKKDNDKPNDTSFLYTFIDFDNIFNKNSPSKWSSYMSSDGFPLAPVYSRVPCLNEYSDEEDIVDDDDEIVDIPEDLDYLLDEIEL